MDGKEPIIAILMALHDAGPWLAPQIASIEGQQHRTWQLIVGDDGARDGGRQQVLDRAAFLPKGQIRLVDGPGVGFAANFLSLLREVGPDVALVAFCDHDDVWLPDKLSRAAAALHLVPAARPALYCARTVICDHDLRRLALSPHFPGPFGFANALVQNVAPGNTIVLNRAAADLALRLLPAALAAGQGRGVPAHDWWLSQIVTGCGGLILRDARPALLYRQHAGNLWGRNDTLGAGLRRLGGLFGGLFRDWTDRNLEALSVVEAELTPENRRILHCFREARRAALPRRLLGFRQSGFHRQTRAGSAALWLAAALQRI